MKHNTRDYRLRLNFLRSLNLRYDNNDLIKYFDFQNGDKYESVFELFFSSFQYFFTKEQGKYNYSKPHLVFIDEAGINAFAWKTDNFSLIGINADTIRKLHQLISETDIGSILWGNLEKFRIMEEVGQENLVNKLYYNCQMFIFFHEFGHIVQNIFKSTTFQNEMANRVNYSEIQHLKEYDADQFAATNMASSAGYWMNGLKDELREKFYNKEVAEMLLVIVCAGCFISFLIFQKGTKDFYTKEWSHPHTSVRAGYIMETIIRAFQENNKGGLEIDYIVVMNDAYELTKRLVDDAISRKVIFESRDDFNKFFKIWVNYKLQITHYFNYLNDMAQNTKGLACEHLIP